MKRAFTIIELIFVVVILGILASVAVPKLAQDKTKGTVFAEIASVGAEIRDDLDTQNKQMKYNYENPKMFTEDAMKKAISNKEHYKQSMMKAQLELRVIEKELEECRNKLTEVNYEFKDTFNAGTGY